LAKILRPKRYLGQNFLIDQNILDLIVESAELSLDDIIIEIGSGTGSLTQKLARSSSKVIAIELDKNLFSILISECKGKNIVPICADVLELSFKDLINGIETAPIIKIIGNLPYYITTPILLKILDESLFLPIKTALVMVQKEVAMRIIASPGVKDYGSLSIAIGYRSKARIVKYVSANCFYPKPKVDSAIIKLDLLDKPSVELEDERLFFQIIRAAFQYRRKTLRNAVLLANGSGDIHSSSFSLNRTMSCLGSLSKKPEVINITTTALDNAMRSLNLDPRIRGENLSISEFADLANNIRS